MSRQFNKFTQTLLAKQGFGVTPDGRDNETFRKAIRDFQAQNGLPVTGTVTTDTLNALKRPVQPLPRPRPPQGTESPMLRGDMSGAMAAPPSDAQPPPVPTPVAETQQPQMPGPMSLDDRLHIDSTAEGNFSNADQYDPLGLMPYLHPDRDALQKALQQKANNLVQGSVNFDNAYPYGAQRDTGPINKDMLIKALMLRAQQVGGGV
ncbi:MAG: peptidoglycan-binding protein [Nitrospira sp.]|nr:peptidoglycan-binding protein [Nitrospira sp.]